MQEEQKLSILKDIIAIQSVNDHERDVAVYLKKLFDEAGIKNDILPLGDSKTRANLVAELGTGKPVLAISGHMDVVEVDADHWATDPFTLTEKDGNLYGRGATDMKAGLAAMVIAMLELKESGTAIPGTIRLLATAGEEVGMPGAKAFKDQGYMDDVDALLITEPSGIYRAIYANKGELNVTVNSAGKAAHSSMPYLGNNAVEHLINVLQNIKTGIQDATADINDDVLGDTVINIDTIKGGNQVNAIPSAAQAEINIRTIPEFDNAKLWAKLQEIIKAYNDSGTGDISVTVGMDVTPISGNSDSKLLKDIQRIAAPFVSSDKMSADELQKLTAEAKDVGIKDYKPGDIIAEGVPGGTDASQLIIDQPMGFDFVMYGPGNNTPHQDNEFVPKSQYLNFIEIYKQLFTEFGK
ncbi:ArgE/DapE family deacylase [Weissella bombi]|uniref:Probable succinyl-diaminopimelate desuccinylase n=1 Tax=Weissella bombi TaxID=1505725 RepID=A0A1C4B1Z2_9LACO|nr:ArgE/DapE family deacylase [Weissella bombi]SCC00758.1 succinyl-diaminopimelate desuccinylase [Weissella bombi]